MQLLVLVATVACSQPPKEVPMDGQVCDAYTSATDFFTSGTATNLLVYDLQLADT